MKYIIALLLLVGSAKAQDTSPQVECTVYRGLLLGINEKKHFVDTVKCIMLCADTMLWDQKHPLSSQSADAKTMTFCYPYRTFSMDGYEVRDDGNLVKYLDYNKFPVYYMVWMSLRKL